MNCMYPRIENNQFRFSDLPAPVKLGASLEMHRLLHELLRGWEVEAWSEREGEPVLTMLYTESESYTISGRWVPQALLRRDAVDAACGFIAELIRAYVHETPSRLCLHAAAAEFGGRLVVFPSAYRAGKSILCAALAAGGVRLAGDDVVMIDAVDGCAIAGGFCPRLRLPLPQTIAPATRTFVERHSGPRGKSYLYLDLGPEFLASKDERFIVGAFVFIDRKAKGPASLHSIDKADALRTVIWQNFARNQPAPDILQQLVSLVERTDSFCLAYSRAEDAAVLLRKHFAVWPESDVFHNRTLETAGSTKLPEPRSPKPPIGGLYRKAGVVERQIDGQCFLADQASGRIAHLNATASALWRALCQPATESQLIVFMSAAFPKADEQTIAHDVKAALRNLIRESWVISRDMNCLEEAH
jgi:hypothetical protein